MSTLIFENSLGNIDINRNDGNYIVTPQKLQDLCRQETLKESLKDDDQAPEISPLDTQVAGHGSEDDGQDGVLQNSLGLIYKPIQDSSRGLRELEFYQKINNSNKEDDVQIRRLIPKFYGDEKINDKHYLVLENLTFGFSKPCVMDIKIGKITYGLDATEDKIARNKKSYPGTKGPFGFSVLGLITHSDQGYVQHKKSFGKSLDQNNLDLILHNFLDVNSKYALNLAKCFLIKLREIEAFFLCQKTYLLFGSSILFVYDYESLASVDWSGNNPVRLGMIDFAHVWSADNSLDDNYIHGLQNVIGVFEKFIAVKTS